MNHQAAYIHLARAAIKVIEKTMAIHRHGIRMAQSGFARQIDVVAGRTDPFVQFQNFLRELPGLAEISGCCRHNRLIVLRGR